MESKGTDFPAIRAKHIGQRRSLPKDVPAPSFGSSFDERLTRLAIVRRKILVAPEGLRVQPNDIEMGRRYP